MFQDKTTLLDIAQAINRILVFKKGLDEEMFYKGILWGWHHRQPLPI